MESLKIQAIPELIKILELAGCIVTIDAMGCQKEIVKTLFEQEADYIIPVKKNQNNLYQNIETLFKESIRRGFAGVEYSRYDTQELSHGREEMRHYLMLSNITEQVDPDKKWLNLKSIGMVESVRTVNGKTTV